MPLSGLPSVTETASALSGNSSTVSSWMDISTAPACTADIVTLAIALGSWRWMKKSTPAGVADDATFDANGKVPMISRHAAYSLNLFMVPHGVTPASVDAVV